MENVDELKNHVYDIVGALHSVHDELGPGINEYCYQEALAMELFDRGIPFEREKAFHPQLLSKVRYHRAIFLRHGQPRDTDRRREAVHRSAKGRGRVSPRAEEKLFQIVVSNH